MRNENIVTCFALLWSGAAAAASCPDTAYEKYLKELSAMVPAVTAEQPAPSALANFFQALPTDFACFNRIFGFNDAPAPLYSEPQLHFLFPQIASVVPKQSYAKKLIGLSVNARWEADQTGALQDAARSVLDRDAVLFVGLLSKLNADFERSVWAFLFGAPHPSNEPLSAAVQSNVCKASVRSCRLSNEAYARAIAEEHNH